MRTEPDFDLVTRIYTHAEALHGLANRLPEQCAGLALILDLLGNDLHDVGDTLDAQPSPTRPTPTA